MPLSYRLAAVDTEKSVVRLVGREQRRRLADQHGPQTRPVRLGFIQGNRAALIQPSRRCSVIEIRIGKNTRHQAVGEN